MSETPSQPVIKSPEARQLFVRLDGSDPTGKEVNAALVSSIQMWVRCMWPYLAPMKRGPAPDHEMLLKDGTIVAPFKVYELHGKVVKNKKVYGDAQVVWFHVNEAIDITPQAQEALRSAKAAYDSKPGWPIDDDF